MQLKVGQTAVLSKTISLSDGELFANLTGDSNPLHMDSVFAGRSRFGKRIAHGMWAASLISGVLGTKLPGPGTIYLSQSLRFESPIYFDDTITASVVIIKIRKDKPIVTLETICRNQNDIVVVRGEAVVLIDSSLGIHP